MLRPLHLENYRSKFVEHPYITLVAPDCVVKARWDFWDYKRARYEPTEFGIPTTEFVQQDPDFYDGTCRIFGFRDEEVAQRFARIARCEVLTIDGAFASFFARMHRLAAAYHFARVNHAGEPLISLLPTNPDLHILNDASPLERAIVLVSGAVGNVQDEEALVRTQQLIDPFGFRPDEGLLPFTLASARVGEELTRRIYRNTDLCQLYTLAWQFKTIPELYPTYSVGDLVDRSEPQWRYLCDASPRARAIALTALALAEVEGPRLADVQSAALLIDGCDMTAPRRRLAQWRAALRTM